MGGGRDERWDGAAGGGGLGSVRRRVGEDETRQDKIKQEKKRNERRVAALAETDAVAGMKSLET